MKCEVFVNQSNNCFILIVHEVHETDEGKSQLYHYR